MPNSPDFRSDQIQVNKLIVSGANAGSAECLLVYPLSAQGTPANQGNINPAIFDTSPIGSDAFFYVSGSVGGKGGSTPTIAVFGGDLHVSGNLSVDGSGASGGSAQIWFSDISGSTYSTGSVQIRNEFVGEISLVVTGSSVIAGIGSYATGSSVASGEETVASGLCSHSEGQYGVASGDYSHSEGYNSTASGNHSHAEGFATTASGAGGHSEGDGTLASGINSHAEGRMATSSGLGSHAEGTMTIASGDYSHAEGRMTRAHADFNHAEGEGAEAFGVGSHAEGFETNAIGNWSHAEGSYTDTPGDFSHASGIRTIASGSGQNVVGKYNLRNNDFSLFVVGNGTDDDDFLRSDIFRVNDTSVEVTGSFISPKITGSLSGTFGGNPFLVAGTNVTTNYNSLGQWEISGSGPSLSSDTPQPLGTATAGVSESAARADHVHDALAAADITDAGAAGIDLMQAASADAAREALRPTTIDAISSTAPWSTRNGEGAYAGTATVNIGGAVDLECLSAGGQVVAAAGRAPWLLRPGMVLMARLSAFSSVASGDSVAFFVTNNLATQTTYSGLQVSGTGVCLVRIDGGGTAGSQTVASITAGQGWMILVARGADVDGYVGVGSAGEPPADADWVYIGTVSRGSGASAPWAIVGAQLNRDAASGNVTATVTGWRYRVWL